MLHHTRNQRAELSLVQPSHPLNTFFLIKTSISRVFTFSATDSRSTAVILSPFNTEKGHIQTLQIYLSKQNQTADVKHLPKTINPYIKKVLEVCDCLPKNKPCTKDLKKKKI